MIHYKKGKDLITRYYVHFIIIEFGIVMLEFLCTNLIEFLQLF